mgnify:CR=1 FL=1
MTLWVFGDSFSSDYPKNSNSGNWCNLWGEQHFDSVKNLSRAGTSNDDIANKIIKTLPEMQSGDSVIVCWSTIYRLCILGTHPLYPWEDFVVKSSDIKNSSPQVDKKTAKLLSSVAQNFFTNFFTETKGWHELITQIIAVDTMLKDNNIKLVQFLGHNDIKSDSELLDYLDSYEWRCIPVELESLFLKYCTKLKNSWCILHSWHKIQSDLMNSPGWEKWSHHKHISTDNDWDRYIKSMFDDFEKSGKNIFLDHWHLNSSGHKLFADYISDILERELV